MPVLDRFWWLRLYPAALALVIGLLVLWLMDFPPAAVSVGSVLISAVALVGLAGVVWVALDEVARARRRKRLRLMVFRAEPVDLLPAPRYIVPRARDLSVTEASLPLRLLWRERWYVRLGASWASLFLWVALYAILEPPLPSVLKPGPTPGLTHAQVVLVVVTALAMLVSVGVFVTAGRPYGVIADEEGVRMRRRVGRSRLVRWSEARLFEVRVPTSGERRRWGEGTTTYVYTLSSTRTYVAWHWPKAQMETSVGATSEEATARGRALLAVVEERTGLVPRMLEQS